MGVNDQQKFCKVTVHRSDFSQPQQKPWERRRATSNARSTVTYKAADPALPTKDELSRWTATGAAAIDGLPMSRRRAHTTTAAMNNMDTPSVRALNPLSRMTMRLQEPLSANSPSMEINEFADRSDSFMCIDTDCADPIRQTFDEETKMFVPGTPPIPSGLSVEMLPTVDFTPTLLAPSRLQQALELEQLFDASTTTRFSSFSSPRESRIRISTPGKESALSSLFGDHADYVDELPTPMLSSTVGTPLEDTQIPPQAENQQDDEDVGSYPEYENHPLAMSFIPASSYEEVCLSDPQPVVKKQEQEPKHEQLPQQPAPQHEQELELVDDNAEDEEALSSFIEVDSDNEDDEEEDHMEMDDSAFDVCENFDAILGEPLPNRGSRWRFSIGQKNKNKKNSPVQANPRQTRGMSSPPRMVGMAPPPNLARHMSIPAAFTPPHNARPKPIVHAPVGEPLYHGQMLHLVFKSSAGNVVQVSTQQRRSKSSVFSKLVECFSTDNQPFADAEDALRIIAHTTDGHIRGGDRISLARGDGSVLRIQKLSKKLSFSPKIDLKAKFVVCGVPEGTTVTDTNKFYLQSVYDRTKTIGFLKDRRHPGAGCLVMYAYRTTDDKSEAIQFFKRETPPSFAQQHTLQQGHALPTTSPTVAFL